MHSDTDLNCDFYDFSNIYRDRTSSHSLVGSNIIYSHRAEHLSDEEVVAHTLREMRENIPAARSAKVVHSAVHRIPMAIHCPYPGTEQLRPEQNTQVEGLYLAGDWVRTGLPSSMEGAAMSGFRVAEELRRAMGHPALLAIPHRTAEGFTELFGKIAAKVPALRQAPSKIRGLPSPHDAAVAFLELDQPGR